MFQTDAPMLPFMFDELSSIIYRLLHLVYRKKKLDEKKNLRELMNEEFLNNDNNKMDEMQVDIGAVAKNSLDKVSLSSEKKRQFRKECKGAIVCILLKLLERKLLIIPRISLENFWRLTLSNRKRNSQNSTSERHVLMISFILFLGQKKSILICGQYVFSFLP